MAYSKDPTAYPPEFAEIFRRALLESVEIDTTDAQQATSFRHQLHGYRRAIEFTKSPGWTTLRNITIKVRQNKIILENNREMLEKFREQPNNLDPTDKELDKYISDMEKDDET